ncbi:MAG: RNB domain-containing ribonuclease [Ornithinimicrobium sp.]
MTERSTTLQTPPESDATARLEAAFASVREEFGVRQGFSDEVVEEAQTAVDHPDLPERDETGIEFITIDPPGSMDLDQAMHIELIDPDGHPSGGPQHDASEAAPGQAHFRVRYAIADVPAFVAAGGVTDAEVRLRGQTIYCPDTRVPLHPTVISEEAASLLPEVTRPAYVWDMLLAEDGRRVGSSLYRAMVRSRRRYTYAEVQAQVDDGSAESSLMLLREVGRLRVARESARGGASLPMPEQEVHVEDGRYFVRSRPVLEAEEWNAQISLLTGIVAAAMMLQGGVGILRTMPPADEHSLARFRRQATALGVDWPAEMAYGDFLRTLDRNEPSHLAVIHDATALFRGAGYTPFRSETPEQTLQSAIAAPYAHVTAPLRRLVDRFGLAVCAALDGGDPVPSWAIDALEELPDIMNASGQQARAVERGCLDAVEAAVLETRVGEVFSAVVVDLTSSEKPIIQIAEPAIAAVAEGEAELGSAIQVRLTTADVDARTVTFVVL